MAYMPGFGAVLVFYCLGEAFCAVTSAIGHATTLTNFSQEVSVRPPIPEWIHCTGSPAWVGNLPTTLKDLDGDCEQAYERMRSVDIDPNWGLGNLFQFLPLGEQPTMGLRVVRVPRRYVFGNVERAFISPQAVADQSARGGREMHVSGRVAAPGARAICARLSSV